MEHPSQTMLSEDFVDVYRLEMGIKHVLLLQFPSVLIRIISYIQLIRNGKCTKEIMKRLTFV